MKLLQNMVGKIPFEICSTFWSSL